MDSHRFAVPPPPQQRLKGYGGSLQSISSLSSLDQHANNNTVKLPKLDHTYHTVRINKMPEKRPRLSSMWDIKYMPLQQPISAATSNASLPTEDYVFSNVRPEYHKLMNDHHLMERCSEAQNDIKNKFNRFSMSPPSLNSISSLESLQYRDASTSTSTSTESNVNIKRIQKWIRYMEEYLDVVSPCRDDVRRMNSFEKRTRLNEHTQIRQYIASYDRIIKHTIKSDERSSTRRNGRQLEDRYLQLLLRSIEVQCLLEGYPEMEKKGTTSTSNWDWNYKNNCDMYRLCDINIKPKKEFRDKFMSSSINSETSLSSIDHDASFKIIKSEKCNEFLNRIEDHTDMMPKEHMHLLVDKSTQSHGMSYFQRSSETNNCDRKISMSSETKRNVNESHAKVLPEDVIDFHYIENNVAPANIIQQYNQNWPEDDPSTEAYSSYGSVIVRDVEQIKQVESATLIAKKAFALKQKLIELKSKQSMCGEVVLIQPNTTETQPFPDRICPPKTLLLEQNTLNKEPDSPDSSQERICLWLNQHKPQSSFEDAEEEVASSDDLLQLENLSIACSGASFKPRESTESLVQPDTVSIISELQWDSYQHMYKSSCGSLQNLSPADSLEFVGGDEYAKVVKISNALKGCSSEADIGNARESSTNFVGRNEYANAVKISNALKFCSSEADIDDVRKTSTNLRKYKKKSESKKYDGQQQQSSSNSEVIKTCKFASMGKLRDCSVKDAIVSTPGRFSDAFNSTEFDKTKCNIVVASSECNGSTNCEFTTIASNGEIVTISSIENNEMLSDEHSNANSDEHSNATSDEFNKTDSDDNNCNKSNANFNDARNDEKVLKLNSDINGKASDNNIIPSDKYGQSVDQQWDNFQEDYKSPEKLLFDGNDFAKEFLPTRKEICYSDNGNKQNSLESNTKTKKSKKHTKKGKENRRIKNKIVPVVAQELPAADLQLVDMKKHRKIAKAVRRSKDNCTSANESSKQRQQEVLFENKFKNMVKLSPSDFDEIIAICHANPGCLKAVLCEETMKCALFTRCNKSSNQQQQQQKDSCYSTAGSLASSTTGINNVALFGTPVCHCGPIAHFVQKVVDFLTDCTNIVRNFTLYKFLMKVMREYYSMIKFFTGRVKHYRQIYSMGAIA